MAGCVWNEPDRVADAASELGDRIEAARSPASDRVPYRSLRQSASPYLGLKPVAIQEALLPEDLVTEFGVTLTLDAGLGDEVLARRVSEAAGIPVRLVGRAPSASEGDKAEGEESAGRQWLAAFTDEYSSEGGLWSGPLDGLLDAWAEAEGYSWAYRPDSESVEIVRSETRVFGINALVGNMQHQVSTQTSGSGGESTTGGSQQSITATMDYKPWEEIAAQVTAAAGEGEGRVVGAEGRADRGKEEVDAGAGGVGVAGVAAVIFE